jgi:SAM-dependent MidA family methyltransferase
VFLSWRAAIDRALYGPDGFYRRAALPSAHFRTSVHASDRFAAAIAVALARIDVLLGSPADLAIVDVGAGGGELLTALVGLVSGPLRDRLRPVGVDLRSRPDGLSDRIEWRGSVPDSFVGLLIANEWLDNVPVDVVELGEDGPHTVLVDPSTGTEQPGSEPDRGDLVWLRRWWPLRSVGNRAEVGLSRDIAWAEAVGRLRAGVAIAVDYGHLLADRPSRGTLAGYRSGRWTRPIPDGSCDVCAHVALDAVLAAGEAVAGRPAILTTQRDALRALGLTGNRPHIAMAAENPAEYLKSLVRSGVEGELLEPAGLGGFHWIVQPVGACFPALECGKMTHG